jgi:drug/metabolite transporter (DMT)-like permease
LKSTAQDCLYYPTSFSGINNGTATTTTTTTTTIDQTEEVYDTYALLLKKFMEEHAASDALLELQEMNTNQHRCDASASTASPTTASRSVKTFEVVDPKQAHGTEERDENDVWNARLLLIGAAALYGTNFSLVKLLGDTMPVGISTTLRFGLASVATLPWLFNSKLFSSDRSQAAAWLGLEVGMWNSIGYVAQAVGLETTLASKSAFICSMAVVVVPLLEFMTGKRLLPRQWVGAVLALVGVGFLELGDGISEALSGMATGDMLSLVQPVVFGIGFWKMEKAMHRYPEEASRMTAAQLFAVFVASATYGVWSICNVANAADSSLSLAAVSSAYPWKEWLTSPSTLFSLFWTGCITTAMTIYMETLALETLSATETTLIFSTEPLWGTAFAAWVMGEQLGMNAAVGAFFILTACIYSNLGPQGVVNLWNSGSQWLLSQTLPSKNEETQSKPSKPSWLQPSGNRWKTWVPSSLATSLATWNVINGEELNEIVDDLIEKFS